MSSIYELTEQVLVVQEMMYDDETDQQVVIDTLESLHFEFEEKADNYAKIIKNLLADAQAIKEEEQRLYSRRVALENRAQSLKDALEYNMREIGKTKFKTTLFSFGIQKNGGKQKLTIDAQDVHDIPEEYLIPQDPIPNNDKIRELLETQSVTWAHLEPRGESLRIR